MQWWYSKTNYQKQQQKRALLVNAKSQSCVMSSRFSQTLLQASLLFYKDANAPRSQYSQSHRSSSTRGDSKSSSKYDHLNELAASAKKSILRNLQQLMPKQSLNNTVKIRLSHIVLRWSFDVTPLFLWLTWNPLHEENTSTSWRGTNSATTRISL